MLSFFYPDYFFVELLKEAHQHSIAVTFHASASTFTLFPLQKHHDTPGAVFQEINRGNHPEVDVTGHSSFPC